MANWEGLRRYIKATYRIQEDGLDHIKMTFDLGNGRSQVIIVGKVGEIEGSDWASIMTPVCDEGQIEPRAAMLRNSEMIVGGLALLPGGPVIFRHTFPLADLDPNEFEQPLKVAAFFGDALEQELAGTDKY